MRPYITFNGISSATYNLGVLNADVHIFPRRRKELENLGGIRALEGDAEYPGGEIDITLAAKGTDKAAVVAAFRAAVGWLSSARYLRLWSNPGVFYEGYVEDVSSVKMITRSVGEITITFVLNPACAQRAIISDATWIPALDVQLPEQISDTIHSAKTVRTTAGYHPAVIAEHALPPALYLAVEGTWDKLKVGTLTITESVPVVYIDCDRQQAYTVTDGTRRIVRHSGEYPTLPDDGKLYIGGTNINITSRLLVIERS